MRPPPPPVPYFGGKQKTAERIASLLPPHRHYVEPFCGSLAVLLAKPRSDMETVNDLDGDLMTFWRVLRDKPKALARACALTPHSRAELAESWAVDGCDDLERARRVWVGLTQGRSAKRRASTGWRYWVKYTDVGWSMANYLESYTARILPAAERLVGVSLECLPGLDVIAKYGGEPEALLYVDPPYLGAARDGTAYRHEMLAPQEHRELAQALAACAAAVVISGYPSDLYDRELYSGWFRSELSAYTTQGGNPGSRVEVVWSNRPLGEPDLFSEVTA